MKLASNAQRQVEKWSWEYLDGIIAGDGFGRLEAHLRNSAEARRTYSDCAMLHGLLIEHYKPASAGRSPFAADPFLTQLLDRRVDAPQEPDVSAERRTDASTNGR